MTPTILVPTASNPASLVTLGTNLFWVNEGTTGRDGSLAEVPIVGGTLTTLPVALKPVAVTVDSSYVYWADETATIRRAGLDLTNPVVLATGSNLGGLLVNDATALYWFAGGGSVPITLLKIGK